MEIWIRLNMGWSDVGIKQLKFRRFIEKTY